MTKGATLSEDRKYRFELHRIFDNSKPLIAFVGLNPSTADEEFDDPTITKCINYAKNWGYGGFYFVNLFAFRATDPKDMQKAEDPIGNGNDKFIKSVFDKVEKVICCWGELGTFMDRGNQVLNFIKNPYYLKLNKNGQPAHPLYLKNELLPIPYDTNYQPLNHIVNPTVSTNKLKSYQEFEKGILNYNNDTEIINYLSNHEDLNYIYQEIEKVSNMAVVVPLVSVVDESNFELDLHIIVKYENQSELGQWNYYLATDFVNKKTNLFVLLKTLEGATNCEIDELIESIRHQIKEQREELAPERKTFMEIENGTIAYGIL